MISPVPELNFVQGVRVTMRNGIYLILALVLALGCVSKTKTEGASKSSAADTKGETSPATVKDAKATTTDEDDKAKPGEVVFDPRKPPPGYTNCHRNHCHRVDGGVSSYQQVMAEMGATRIVGVPKQKPMPPAPADVAAPGPDATKTASGLATKVLSKGSGGANPTDTDIVSIHFSGWTADGKAFDSSVSRGRPASFPLDKVFPGWKEGIKLMTVGEERRFWIPQELAFNGRPGSPQGTLCFDVELLEIRPASGPPQPAGK